MSYFAVFCLILPNIIPLYSQYMRYYTQYDTIFPISYQSHHKPIYVLTICNHFPIYNMMLYIGKPICYIFQYVKFQYITLFNMLLHTQYMVLHFQYAIDQYLVLYCSIQYTTYLFFSHIGFSSMLPKQNKI